MGYFLQSSGRDYVIFERNASAGESYNVAREKWEREEREGERERGEGSTVYLAPFFPRFFRPAVGST